MNGSDLSTSIDRLPTCACLPGQREGDGYPRSAASKAGLGLGGVGDVRDEACDKPVKRDTKPAFLETRTHPCNEILQWLVNPLLPWICSKISMRRCFALVPKERTCTRPITRVSRDP